MRLVVLLGVAALPAGCGDLDVVTSAYATKAEAEAAGAMERGWIPAGVPSSTHEIREAHDLDTNRRWGLFNFAPSDGDALRALLRPGEAAVDGLRCDIPGRIEWWPPMLRGAMNGERLKTAALAAYRTRDGELIVLVNWLQGRAYYWSE
jgi:hypothetical protein